MNSSNFNSSRKHQTTHSVPFTPKKKRLDPFSTAAIDLNENKNNSSAQELNIAREFALLVRQHGNDPFAHADRFASMTTRGERDTWMLLLGLNKDRIDVAMRRMRALDNGGAADVSAQSCERLDVVESALANDDSLRELSIVVRWLERIHDLSQTPPAPLQSAWLDTARAIADRRLGKPIGNDDDDDDDNDDRIVQADGEIQLDPDAPIRQLNGVQLEPSDANDERRLLAELWRLVRGGRLDVARKLCRDADQPWRAAVLAGDELSLDKRRRGLAVASRSGNWSRYAWKSACLALAHADVASVHERAIHGVLAGSLRAMLLCCNSYDDYLWAHLRAALDRRIDDALAAYPDDDVDAAGGTGAAVLDLGYVDYVQQRDRIEGAPPPLDVRDIVALLRKSTVAEVRDGARDPFRRLQALVINDDVSALMATLARWLQRKPDATGDIDAPLPAVTPQLLRFAAHVVLFFNAGGLSNTSESADCCTVLRAYIDYLMRERETPLVAQYVALLPDDHERVDRFVQYMEHITEPAERQRCLVEAEKAGLDVAAVTRNVVERARAAPTAADAASAAAGSRRPSTFAAATTSAVAASIAPSLSSSSSMAVPGERRGGDNSADEARVRSLGWLCFDPLQRTEAMRQANALMREFVCEGKIERCEQIVRDVLPADSLELVDDAAKAAPGQRAWHYRRIAREHRDLCTYVEAMRAFERWLEHWTRKQSAPTAPVRTAKSLYSDEVMYKRQLDQYEAKLGAWQTSAQALLNEAHEVAHRVLQQEGGFLVDQERASDGESEPEPERAASVQRVRAHAVPTLYLALSRALLAAGRTAQVTQLACYLADERLQLLSCFAPKDLADVLETCRRAAIGSVAQGRDSVGFAMDEASFLSQMH